MHKDDRSTFYADQGKQFADQIRQEARGKTPVESSYPLKTIAELTNHLSSEPFWDENFTEFLGYLARQHGTIHVERFLEGLADLPVEDAHVVGADIYISLAGTTFRHLGRTVGDEFSRSYAPALKYGVTPEVFFEEVSQAAMDGGKVFAKAFAANSPWVVRTTGDISDFRIASTMVKERGGLSFARSFIDQGESVAKLTNASLVDSAHLAVEAIDRIGVKAAHWGFPGIQILDANSDYTPEQYFSDAENVQDSLGPQYTSWFTAGLLTIGKELQRIRHLPERGKQFGVPGSREYVTVFEYPKYTEDEVASLLSPEQFKESFMRLAHLGKTSTAVLYSMLFDPINLLDSEDLIYEAHASLGSKQFRDASYLLRKAWVRDDREQAERMREMLRDFTRYSNAGDEKDIEKLIKYNLAIVKNGRKIKGVHIPRNMQPNPESPEAEVFSLEDFLRAKKVSEDEFYSVYDYVWSTFYADYKNVPYPSIDYEDEDEPMPF